MQILSGRGLLPDVQWPRRKTNDSGDKVRCSLVLWLSNGNPNDHFPGERFVRPRPGAHLAPGGTPLSDEKKKKKKKQSRTAVVHDQAHHVTYCINNAHFNPDAK